MKSHTNILFQVMTFNLPKPKKPCLRLSTALTAEIAKTYKNLVVSYEEAHEYVVKSARPNAKSIDTAKELLNYLEIPDGANTLKLNLAGNHQKLSVLTQTMVNSCRTLHQYLGEMSTKDTIGGAFVLKTFDHLTSMFMC